MDASVKHELEELVARLKQKPYELHDILEAAEILADVQTYEANYKIGLELYRDSSEQVKTLAICMQHTISLQYPPARQFLEDTRDALKVRIQKEITNSKTMVVAPENRYAALGEVIKMWLQEERAEKERTKNPPRPVNPNLGRYLGRYSR